MRLVASGCGPVFLQTHPFFVFFLELCWQLRNGLLKFKFLCRYFLGVFLLFKSDFVSGMLASSLPWVCLLVSDLWRIWSSPYETMHFCWLLSVSVYFGESLRNQWRATVNVLVCSMQCVRYRNENCTFRSLYKIQPNTIMKHVDLECSQWLRVFEQSRKDF